MSLYNDLVALSKEYVGFAGELLVKRILKEIGKTPNDLAKGDLLAFANRIPDALGASLPPEKKKKFQDEVKGL